MKLKLILTAIALCLISCANKPADQGTVVSTQLDKMMLEKSNLVAKHVVAGIGEGIASKQQIALNKAEMAARADIAKTLTAKSQELSKQYYEEAGEEVTEHYEQVNRQIASEKISGATAIKMVTEVTPDKKYKVTVLMAMDPAIFDEIMSASLKAAESEKIRNRAAEGYRSAQEAFDAYDAAKNAN